MKSVFEESMFRDTDVCVVIKINYFAFNLGACKMYRGKS